MRLARVVALGALTTALFAACTPATAPAPKKQALPAHKKTSQSSPTAQTCDAHWRGYVKPSDHNYAGIGAYNGSDRYMCKPTAMQGVRAQIQHLRNYADPTSVSTSLGAPFEERVKYDAQAFDTFPYKGKAPRWEDLEGKWAVPGTTYWDVIKQVYDEMRKYSGRSSVDDAYTIRGSSELTAQQIAAYVQHVGNPWKPEISPLDLAKLYISEGNAADVRGDVAFCQSILETGWFSWPTSPAVTGLSVPDTTSPSTTSSTLAQTQDSTPGSSPTTSSTVATPPQPVVDPVVTAYLELQASVTARY